MPYRHMALLDKTFFASFYISTHPEAVRLPDAFFVVGGAFDKWEFICVLFFLP